MKYSAMWKYPFSDITQFTTFDNELCVTYSGDTVPCDEFDIVTLYMGNVLLSPSLSANMSAGTSAWSSKFFVDETLHSCEYAYYSVVAQSDDDVYEIKNGLVFIKSIIGGNY